MSVLSIDYERLYARGGWYGEESIARDSAANGPLAQHIFSLYAPYEYQRDLPANVASSNAESIEAVVQSYRDQSNHFRAGASCEVYLIENVLLLDRTIYVPLGTEWVALYETHRPFERELKTVPWPALDIPNARSGNDAVDYLYFGSVSSENYGHWMIDGIACAKAVSQLKSERPMDILLDRYHAIIDSARAESLARAIGNVADTQLTFIEKKEPYFFRRLYYVTPPSYQAILKSPDAIDFSRAALQNDSSNAPLHLFVDRAGLWRNLINRDEVALALGQAGFTRIDTDGMGTAEQAAIFSRAQVVVGVIGAAMVNTIFTPPGARIIYLAPDGFLDPFYWDLAQTNRHEYRLIFGTPKHPHRPNFSSFGLDDRMQATLRDWM